VLSFEHIKFVINENYLKINYGNPNNYVEFMIFETYKNAILRSVHSLGWLFDYVFTLVCSNSKLEGVI
jgi:hypothetical protein